MAEQHYISVDDAATRLKVTKATLYYYIKTLKLETHKFPLDRRAYLTSTDFETIKTLKDQASQRSDASGYRLDEDEAA